MKHVVLCGRCRSPAMQSKQMCITCVCVQEEKAAQNLYMRELLHVHLEKCMEIRDRFLYIPFYPTFCPICFTVPGCECISKEDLLAAVAVQHICTESKLAAHQPP